MLGDRNNLHREIDTVALPLRVPDPDLSLIPIDLSMRGDQEALIHKYKNLSYLNHRKKGKKDIVSVTSNRVGGRNDRDADPPHIVAKHFRILGRGAKNIFSSSYNKIMKGRLVVLPDH